jgi:hypothetical protein
VDCSASPPRPPPPSLNDAALPRSRLLPDEAPLLALIPVLQCA